MLDRLKQNRFLWYQGPMIAWAIVLFTQSSIPGDRLPGWELLSHDKIIHFFIYVVFAFTVQRAIRHQTKYPLLAKHQYLVTFVIIALYGASDEFHQYFIPNRSCSWNDWFADSLGAVLFVGFDWVRTKLRPSVASA
jgi:hypothetical protein